MTAPVPLDQPEAGSSTGPHRIRITTGGSMESYVKFALDFLQTNPNRSLILHTRPPSPSSRPASAPGGTQPRSNSTLQPCTLAAPRLISVAELIKREYMAIINGNGKGKGKHRAVGIWQYTKSGLVDPTELGLGLEGAQGDDGANGLARILEGKLKPKMTHYPYLEITLSTQPLGLDKEPDTSCQYLLSARHRNRKAKKEGASEGEADVEMQDGEAIPDTGVAVAREPPGGKGADKEGAGERRNVSKGTKEDGKKRKVKPTDSVEGAKTKKARAGV